MIALNIINIFRIGFQIKTRILHFLFLITISNFILSID